MKTLQQKAQEYCDQDHTTRSEYAAFVAGYYAAKEDDRWRGVDEELPKIAQLIIIKIDGDDTMVSTARYKGNNCLVADYSEFNAATITHWKPIND